MQSFLRSIRAPAWAGWLIGAVWCFHGLWSKILGGIPRHRLIVGRVLGEDLAGPATILIGGLEIALGVWAVTGRLRPACAAVQTGALLAMNTLEIWRAKDLLLAPWGMVALNAAFLVLVWLWAKPLKETASPTGAGRRR